MDETKTYKLTAEYNKATYHTEEWTNILSNGKKVIVEITTFFRFGEFEIELTDKEKKEILKKDSIVLNDYNTICNELWDGSDVYQEIPNEDNLTSDEKKELHKLMYCNRYEPENYDPENDNIVDQDVLEENDWSMDDTTYGLSCNCVLDEI